MKVDSKKILKNRIKANLQSIIDDNLDELNNDDIMLIFEESMFFEGMSDVNTAYIRFTNKKMIESISKSLKSVTGVSVRIYNDKSTVVNVDSVCHIHINIEFIMGK